MSSDTPSRGSARAQVDAVRGKFLAAMIDTEAHLDRAMVYFFAPDELRIFVETVLDRLSLAAKVAALRAMARKVDMYETHREFLKELDDLRQERNRFAHEAFELVGNSYTAEGADFQLYRKERLDPGPHVDDIIRLSDLEALAMRALSAEKAALAFERELTKVHDPPDEYFHRPGWDPHGRFS
jgi:hypothetical protein